MTDHTPETATESNAGARTVDSLPSWAQKVIRDLRSEAAQNRQTASEAQTELNSLRERLTAVDTKAALDSLVGTLTDPEDLARFVDTAALVDDDGRPDPAKYVTAATELVAARPHLGIPKPLVGRSGNPVGGDRPRPFASDPESQAANGTADFVAMVQGGL